MGQFYSLENWKTNFTFPTSARPLKEKVFVQQSVSLGRRQDHPGGHSSLWHGLVHFVCVCVCPTQTHSAHTERTCYVSAQHGTKLIVLPGGGPGLCKYVSASGSLDKRLWTVQGSFIRLSTSCLTNTQLKWLLLPLGRSFCPLEKRSESSYSLP